MITSRFSAIFLILAGPALGQDVSVPSGMDVTLFDVIVEAEPPTARFRFVAPDIGPDGVQFVDVVDDFQHICDTLIRPALLENGWESGDIVVSLSASEVPFGATVPDVAQYFQPFSLQKDACVWEDF